LGAKTLILTRGILPSFILISVLIASCGKDRQPAENLPKDGKVTDSPVTNDYALLAVAQSERLWTGVAVSNEGRIFVNYPRWWPEEHISVAELTATGEAVAYPSQAWNSPNARVVPKWYFVCVQSVYIDRENYLWILDSGQDPRQGIIAIGPKLIKVDLKIDRVINRYYFDSTIAPSNSYLNDVRIDTERDYAYLTDSGLGAIIVLNLATNESRRLLTGHASTKAENITLSIEGQPWARPDGSAIRVHSDGLALDPSGEYLYYQALTGRSLYRISTEALRDPTLSVEELSGKVEFVKASGASDAIEFGPDGNLYLTAIEHNAIRCLTPAGEVETVIRDQSLKWPDSFAITANGDIYVTTSQIHRIANPSGQFGLYKLVAK
jgi:sugar lactone lactonase YvrE